jgi:hypothetical protein
VHDSRPLLLDVLVLAEQGVDRDLRRHADVAQLIPVLLAPLGYVQEPLARSRVLEQVADLKSMSQNERYLVI